MQLDPEPEPDSFTYVIILLALICLSAFFSASETAFTSLNRARLKTRAQDGNKKSVRALKVYENYDRLLFTLLIGNNIVNITASTIATLLFINLLKGGAWENYSATVSTVVLTLVILTFGEILPKTFAKERPEAFAEVFSGILQFFMVILYPLCAVFMGLKKLLSKVFKMQKGEGVTEEEILSIVEEAGEEGSISEGETELISSAIEFHDCEVGEILIPRVNVVAIPSDMSMEEIKDVFFKNAYSRLPVYTDTIDHIVGMIHEKDFLAAIDRGETSINSLIKKVAIATEQMKISTLLKVFQKSRVHLAIVVDEYGGTLGIVTLEDVLEELVGEIWDEHDEVVEYFNKVNDNTYRVDANADLGDFFELFSLEAEDDDFESQTVGGWVAEKFGSVPKKNSALDFEHLHIIVTRSDQRRVYEIKVVVLSDATFGDDGENKKQIEAPDLDLEDEELVEVSHTEGVDGILDEDTEESLPSEYELNEAKSLPDKKDENFDE